MNWPTVPLGDLCDITVGRTPARNNPAFWGPGEPWVSIADMNQGLVITDTKEQITPAAAKSGKLVEAGTVMLSFKLSIGKVGIAGRDLYTNEAIAALPIRNSSQLLPEYLLRALQVADLAGGANRAAMGATLNKAKLQQFRIPVPPLDEQRRIAAILDQADQVRHRVRSERDAVIALKVPIFSEMFGKYEPDAALGDLADVQGGLQVSGKRATLPVELPYLRVANVYRDHLDLLEMKTIRATQAEADRTRLVIGDLLFVEGHGNPDEVGRAAVWDGSIPNCVHQNHLIRARLNHTKLLPEFAVAWFNSPSGASYFKRAGKTTSGLNTISASQVRSAPIPVPSLDEQREFTRQCEQISHVSASCDRSMLLADELVSATQSRAFSGRL